VPARARRGLLFLWRTVQLRHGLQRRVLLLRQHRQLAVHLPRVPPARVPAGPSLQWRELRLRGPDVRLRIERRRLRRDVLVRRLLRRLRRRLTRVAVRRRPVPAARMPALRATTRHRMRVDRNVLLLPRRRGQLLRRDVRVRPVGHLVVHHRRLLRCGRSSARRGLVGVRHAEGIRRGSSTLRCAVLDVGTADATKPVCGDGIVEPPEECDLGPNNGAGKGCQSDCTWTCVATDPKRDCATGKPCTGTPLDLGCNGSVTVRATPTRRAGRVRASRCASWSRTRGRIASRALRGG
jgi:cysteine-rich repeat protein